MKTVGEANSVRSMKVTASSNSNVATKIVIILIIFTEECCKEKLRWVQKERAVPELWKLVKFRSAVATYLTQPDTLPACETEQECRLGQGLQGL